MPHGEYAECPNCGKVAHGEDEIEELFGYRYDGTKPQSWCRECRSGNPSGGIGNLISNLLNKNKNDK